MKILAALDLSDVATTVLEKAVAIAKQEGASLTLLTVAEDFKDIGDYLDAGSVTEKFLAAAKKAADTAKSGAKALGVDAQTVVEQGVSPADLIVRQASEMGADLIVMGSKGKTGIDRFLVGSVTAKVVSHAPCSVLVLR